MPKYRITGPDGSTYEVNAPEGATEQDAIAYVQQNHVQPTAGPPKKSNARSMGQEFKDAFVKAGAKQFNLRSGGPLNAGNTVSATLGLMNDLTNAAGAGIGSAFYNLTGGKSLNGKGNAPIEVQNQGGQKVYRFNGDGPWIPVPTDANGKPDLAAISQIERPMITERATQDRLGNATAQALTFAIPGGPSSKTATEGLGLAEGLAKAPRLRSPVNPDVALLRSRGVEVLPGAAKGGLARNLEDISGKLPIVGTAKKAASQRSIESFNKAVLNDALKPIDESLPADIPAGHEANAHAYDTIQKAYNANQPAQPVLLPRGFADVTAHPDFAILAPESQASLERIMNGRILSKAPSGELDGRNFGKAVELLREDIKRTGQQGGEGQLVSNILKDKLDELIGEASVQDPAYAARKLALDEAYAKVKTAQKASQSVAAENGVFMPSQYLSAVKAADSSAGKNRFATGRAFNQDFAQAAKNVLSDRVPNTGGEVGIMGNAIMQTPTAIGGIVGGPLGAAIGFGGSTGGLYAASRAYEPAAISRFNAALDRKIAGSASQVNIPRLPKGAPLRLPAPPGLATGAPSLNSLSLPPLLPRAAAEEPPRKRRRKRKARPS